MSNPWDNDPIVEMPWARDPVFDPSGMTIDPNGRPAVMRPPRADAGYDEPTPPQPGNWWQENIIGRGEADTGGERVGALIGDMIRGTGSGIVRGATGLADLPGRAADLALRGVGNVAESVVGGGNRAPAWADQISEIVRGTNPFAPSGLGTAEQGVRNIPGGDAAMDYAPETTAGDYAQNVGEFLPGALLFGGAGAGQGMGRAAMENAVRYGLIPGVASEAAGQATEGTAAEPYARTAAALASGVLAARPSNAARPIIPSADPEDARMAGTLMRNGVRPTAGQVTRSSALRRMEGTLDAVPGQAEDFTAAAMRTTGSTAARATPDALRAASDDIVRTMDDAVAGVSFLPSPQMAQQADDVVQGYLRATAEGSVVPDVRNVADEIMDAATNPNAAQISLSTLQDWRSRLGRLMRSPDGQVREAAWGLRSIIDDATEAQLQSAGRSNDVARLSTAREQYRNWLAVSDASTRAGAENGIISPTQLNQSVIRSQGRRNASIGNTTELGELSRSGAGILRAEPTVSAGGVRSISTNLGGSLGGAAAGYQLMPGNPVLGGLVGGVAGSGAIGGGQAAMRSRAVQNFLMDPRNQIIRAMIAAGPGTVSQ